MRTFTRTQFNGTTDRLIARVNAFKAAQVAHAKTVGIPAPREDDFIEDLVRSGEPFEVEAPPPEPSAAELAAAELEQKRAAALFALQRPEIEAAAAAQRAKDDATLDLAMTDPNAAQEVKDYADALIAAPAPAAK